MSAEGDHNLDNDGAADLLMSIADELSQRIVELLQHPRGHEYDDEEISELFVRIEVRFALHDRGILSSAPEPELLRALIDPYVARWEAYHRDAGHEPPTARKESMVATFQELYRISIVSLQRERVFVEVNPDPASMSDEDRINHEKMMRIMGGPALENPERE